MNQNNLTKLYYNWHKTHLNLILQTILKVKDLSKNFVSLTVAGAANVSQFRYISIYHLKILITVLYLL
jgi:hypothetical protein